MARELLPIRQPVELSVLPDRVWTAEEWDVIKVGHISTDMDDRWHVVVEGDHLWLHRSWTGNGIAEAWFGDDPQGRRIVRAAVEADPERYRRRSDELEVLRLQQVIEAVLLNQHDKELSARIRDLG